MSEDESTELLVCLRFDEGTPSSYGTTFGHITGEVLTISAGIPRGLSSDHDLHGLMVVSQLDNTSHGAYGWDLEFRAYRIRYSDAERALKAFKRIRSKMGQIEGVFGPPDSYGEFVTRVAAALGIKRFFITRREGQTWSQGDYQIVDPTGARYRIDSWEREWVNRFKEQSA